MSLMQFCHTLRHLRGCQIAGQLRLRLKTVYENSAAFLAQNTPGFPGVRWQPKGRFLGPQANKNSVSDVMSGRLVFLNQMENIGWPPQWCQERLPRLWQYNLHYFDYLWALDYDQAKTIVVDWIAHHALGHRRVGWEPYPISLRLMNWCCVFFGEYRKPVEADRVFLQELWRSIYLQTEWLSRHIETHLLGNHLFENGVALALVGSCFNGKAAEHWYRKGRSILTAQIQEQILTDGMHFERSPMYHLRITYLLAILLNVRRSDLTDLIKEPLRRMVTALGELCHPDGEIALFNDSGFGVYNTPEETAAYAMTFLAAHKSAQHDCRREPFALEAAGYYGFRDLNGTYIICDAAPIGPDYIPGHSHADMFSFELSLKNHRVVVDSGVYDYEPGLMRDYCRSTKAHNTVELRGQDQCEMWAVHRVARRGWPRSVKWVPGETGFYLSAWHDGYKRLKGKPLHYRTFGWHNPGRLTVRDRVAGICSQTTTSRIHLHPECEVENIAGNSVQVAYAGGRLGISFSGNGRLSVEDSLYCPSFGEKLENQALSYRAAGTDVEVSFVIEQLSK